METKSPEEGCEQGLNPLVCEPYIVRRQFFGGRTSRITILSHIIDALSYIIDAGNGDAISSQHQERSIYALSEDIYGFEPCRFIWIGVKPGESLARFKSNHGSSSSHSPAALAMLVWHRALGFSCSRKHSRIGYPFRNLHFCDIPHILNFRRRRKISDSLWDYS
jgi:hypothetical protein